MTCSKHKTDWETASSGDVVLVRGTVTESNTERVFVRFSPGGFLDGGYASWIPRACVASIEPRPLKVGDVVRGNNWIASANPKAIVAIDGGFAWVRGLDTYGDMTQGVYALNTLEKVK